MKLDLGPYNEPYSFAALVRRNPEQLSDFVDTIPTAPADLADPRLDALRDRDFGAFRGLAWALPASAALIGALALIVIWLT